LRLADICQILGCAVDTAPKVAIENAKVHVGDQFNLRFDGDLLTVAVFGSIVSVVYNVIVVSFGFITVL